MSLNSLKIRYKLSLIVGVLAIPLVLFAFLFLQQSFKDIHFADKERDGVAYLKGAWATLNALVDVGTDRNALPASKLAGAPSLSELAAKFDAGMATSEAFNTLSKRLSAVGWPSQRIQDETAIQSGIEEAKALITSITDGSNLTLDPDLDSYYAMDVVAFKLPGLIADIGDLMAEANVQKGMTILTDDIKANLMISLGKFNDTVSNVAGALDTAFQKNVDGRTRAAMSPSADAFSKTANEFGTEMKRIASEVRSLAQRSSAAAKDIKGLIVESVSQVKDGVKLVHNAGTSLSEIVELIKRVADIISEIASASREQSTGVEEINKAVAQMDEMTQQNSALVEENAAACRMLQEQAQGMQHRMSSFVIDGSETPRQAADKPRAAKPAAKQPSRQLKSPVKKVASGGAAGMQAALQANFEGDADWKEF